MTETAISIPRERIEREIFLVRGQKVMLDSDLARLYGVETKVLNQAIKRNKERFPEDFMFQLSWEELESALRSQMVTLDSETTKKPLKNNGSLRSQFVTLKRGQHRKFRPFAFTEQGVAMLSSVLGSPRAVQVNIAIMRTFVQLRQILASHADLAKKLQTLEKKYDSQFKIVFDAIRELMEPVQNGAKRQMGFSAIQKDHERKPKKITRSRISA
jgi:hypothetical protein